MRNWPYYVYVPGRRGGKPDRYPYLVVYEPARTGDKTVAKCKTLRQARILCAIENRIYRRKQAAEKTQMPRPVPDAPEVCTVD